MDIVSIPIRTLSRLHYPASSFVEAIQNLEKSSLTIKEGIEYRLKVSFKIQHDVVSGLKYLHVVKRGGIRVDKMQEMVGSYGPSPGKTRVYHLSEARIMEWPNSVESYTKKFPLEEAPSGMLARGHYHVKVTMSNFMLHVDYFFLIYPVPLALIESIR